MWFKKKNKKEVDLRDHLRGEKKVIIDGVIFRIKKVDVEDHLAGFGVVFKIYELYKKDPPKAPETNIDNYKKIRTFLRDIICAGVVKPKITIKKNDDPDLIHVDEILNDFSLAQKLANEIINHSYSKKK